MNRQTIDPDATRVLAELLDAVRPHVPIATSPEACARTVAIVTQAPCAVAIARENADGSLTPVNARPGDERVVEAFGAFITAGLQHLSPAASRSAGALLAGGSGQVVILVDTDLRAADCYLLPGGLPIGDSLANARLLFGVRAEPESAN